MHCNGNSPVNSFDHVKLNGAIKMETLLPINLQITVENIYLIYSFIDKIWTSLLLWIMHMTICSTHFFQYACASIRKLPLGLCLATLIISTKSWLFYNESSFHGQCAPDHVLLFLSCAVRTRWSETANTRVVRMQNL